MIQSSDGSHIPPTSSKVGSLYNKISNLRRVLDAWLCAGFKYFLFSSLFGEDFQFD